MAEPRRSGWTYRIGARGIFAAASNLLIAAVVFAVVALDPSPPGWTYALAFVGGVLLVWGLFIPFRVTVYPDGQVAFRSLLRRRVVPATGLESAEDTLRGWGVRFTLWDGWPVRLPFRVAEHADLMARLRELNPRLQER